jgi:hypothetical protein
MDAKRTIAAVVVGAAVLYGVGYLLFNMMFASFYAANAGTASGVDRTPQIFWALAVAYIAYAYLIVFALRFRPTPGAMGTGFLVGATVGFLIWFVADFVLYGVTNTANLTRTMVDPLLELVHGGIAGLVIAAIRGGGTATTA